MKRGTTAGIAIVLVIGGLVAWYVTRPTGPRALVLKVSGPAGLKVSATLVADGRSSTEERALPCEFTATANKLDFEITKLGAAEGQIRVEVYADGMVQGSVGSLKSVSGQLEFEGRTTRKNVMSG